MNSALKSALSHFQEKDGELVIGDKSITKIANEFNTPFYIYDTSIIKWRYKQLKRIIPTEIEIYYAIKANSNIEILELIGGLYNGVDIASLGEMKTAMSARIPSMKMSFAGPGKTLDELSYAIKNNIGIISVENKEEIIYINNLSKSLNKVTSIVLRVNPDFDLTNSGMKMGGGSKQFGIDSEKIPLILTKIKELENISFRGIHIYAGSQILDAESVLNTYKQIFEYAQKLKLSLGIQFSIINMGGGFGIPYFSNNKDLNLKKIGMGLRNLLNNYKNFFPETKFILELGRYIIGECGLYVSRVLYKKKSRGQIFLIIDGGLHHHLAASGNFGQSLVRRSFPMTLLNKIGKQTEKVNVVGKLCTPLDTFGVGIKMPKAEIGDLIGVFNSGAYGYSASPLNFLSHPPPLEIVI
jgi:diaminopimelate decarboxylase